MKPTLRSGQAYSQTEHPLEVMRFVIPEVKYIRNPSVGTTFRYLMSQPYAEPAFIHSKSIKLRYLLMNEMGFSESITYAEVFADHDFRQWVKQRLVSGLKYDLSTPAPEYADVPNIVSDHELYTNFSVVLKTLDPSDRIGRMIIFDKRNLLIVAVYNRINKR
jgi:hypothetical protein